MLYQEAVGSPNGPSAAGGQPPAGIHDSGQGPGKAWINEKPTGKRTSFRQRNSLGLGLLPLYSV